ncbi:transposase [Bosea sp. Root670]|uniref:transposase n=1 Tax=Bosea sp. Root670 TaxID=1736583 RepID=UPI0012E3DF56|nr:transposase [Bosea sp. Root670]
MKISISTPMPDDRNCHVIDALEIRPFWGRRGWSVEAKVRLVAETYTAGANVSTIARRAGMAPSQLFGWRRQALDSGAFAPAAECDPPLSFTRFEAARSAPVEIVVGDSCWPRCHERPSCAGAASGSGSLARGSRPSSACRHCRSRARRR